MLRISFQGSDQTLIQNLNGKRPRILLALRTKLDALDIALQAKIVGEKLSGQVLQHRSGKLPGSIRYIPATIAGLTLAGYVEGGGGPALYGRFHEYGTDRAY